MKNWNKMVLGLVCCWVLFPAASLFAAELQGVETETEAGHFVTKYKFDEKIEESAVSTDFLDRSVQIIFSTARMPTDKNLVAVNQQGIKNVYTTKEEQGGIRSKIVFEKPFGNVNMKDSVMVKADGVNLKVYIKKPDEVWATTALGWTETTAPAALEAEVQNVIQAATAEVTQAPVAAPALAPVADAVPIAAEVKNTENLKETEIPVFADKKQKKADTTDSTGRVFMSMVVIVLLAGGMFFFSKWYARNNKKDLDNNRIRVLNQHFLGPKKSLAIIRVAGETILIGVTDQNISMIKALSLLDDELPESTPQNFAATLTAADQASTYTNQAQAKPKAKTKTVADEDVEEFVVGNIKDKISMKLKDLRPI